MPCCKSKIIGLKTAINSMGLTPIQLGIIKDRFLNIVEEAEKNRMITNILYYTLTNMVTIGGVVILAFISLQKFNFSETSTETFYWFSWVLTTVVTIANKLVYSLNLHKKFISSNQEIEKYYSEGWSFIEGIGLYKIGTIDEKVQLFYSRIEKIKAKTIKVFTINNTITDKSVPLTDSTNSTSSPDMNRVVIVPDNIDANKPVNNVNTTVNNNNLEVH
jgi:hypothetical protein